MKTIAIINNKGGVGKTASTTAVSHILAAMYKKRVLVVDVDPQGNTTNLFGKVDFYALIRARMGNKDAESDFPLSVSDLLIDHTLHPESVIHKTDYENLDLLPALLNLATIEEQLKCDVRRPQQYRLKDQLKKVENDYDYCLIDCSPSASILNINALVAADEVYIPTLADDGSLCGVEETITRLVEEVMSYSDNLRVGGIYLTRYKGYKVSKLAYDTLKAVYPDLFLPITISENVAVQESTHLHKPLLAYDPKARTRAAKDYLDLAGYIAAPGKKKYLHELAARKESEKAAKAM